jgi:predicted membrane channel-forming protein YqfA (hemolysin III family)
MLRVRKRPVGVWLVGIPIAAEGLSLYGAAFQLMAASADDWLAALASVAIGTMLIVKAHALWSFHKIAWLTVIALSVFGGTLHAVEITRGHGAPGLWLSVGWAVATVVYLTHPAIRVLFASSAPAPTKEAS